MHLASSTSSAALSSAILPICLRYARTESTEVVSSASLRAWRSASDSSSSQSKSRDCSPLSNGSAGSSAPSLASATSSFGRSRDAGLGSLRSNSISLTGASCVFPGALVTRRPPRDAVATPTIPTSSTRVPGDTETSGGNLTEREMQATELRPPQGPVATWVPLNCTGKRAPRTGRIVRANAGLPATEGSSGGSGSPPLLDGRTQAGHRGARLPCAPEDNRGRSRPAGQQALLH